MRPRWRLFRQDAGRVAGPPAIVYGLLFVLSLAIGQWSIAKYSTVVVWTANGVLLAALLQLPKKSAIRLLAACLAINLLGNWLRHDSPRMLALNVALNFGEVLLAGLIARRVCGAALDLRRPGRLIRFAFLAVAPAVLISAIIGTTVAGPPPGEGWWDFEFWVTIESLGIMIVTPSLILLARGHRFIAAPSDLRAGKRSRRRGSRTWAEKIALMALLALVCAGVFSQTAAPLVFLVFLPLMLIAFRLSPNWSAAAIILVAAIAGGFTLNGYGPMMLSRLGPSVWHDATLLPMLRSLMVMHIFLAAVLAVALPASTVMTERRRLEARLRARTDAAIEARRLAEQAVGAKSRFLSMMSHEMRTPLNGVSGFAELLAARPDLDPDAAAHVASIRRSSDRLLGLVDEILDFSRGEMEITPAPFSLAAVLAEAADAVRPDAEAQGLTLTLGGDLDPTERRLGDARRVRQVLGHLLSNAVKFTERGGVELTVAADSDGITLTIADTGAGLDEALLADLFEPFSQADASTSRRHDGAGMGLALSRRLADLMGGAVTGANRPSGGAVFTLSLPLPSVEPAVVVLPAADAVADLEEARAPRILVVDDHPTNREVARLMLASFGCEVAMACDGLEAVAAMGEGRFDLILMDVRMPKMDGLEATRAIRALPGPAATTAIVAMTADTMPEDVARCLAAGMNAHQAKPISLAGLGAVLEQFLGDPDAEAELAA